MAVIYRTLCPPFDPAAIDGWDIFHLAAVLGRGTRTIKAVRQDDSRPSTAVQHLAPDEAVTNKTDAPVIVARARGKRQ